MDIHPTKGFLVQSCFEKSGDSNSIAVLPGGQQSDNVQRESTSLILGGFSSESALSNALTVYVCPVSHQILFSWTHDWQFFFASSSESLKVNLCRRYWIIRCWVWDVKSGPLRHSFCWFQGCSLKIPWRSVTAYVLDVWNGELRGGSRLSRWGELPGYL